jgi:hypothetical protein
MIDETQFDQPQQRDSEMIERQVHAIAGLLIILGISLSYIANPMWIWLAVMVALGMVHSAITGQQSLVDIVSAAPWNRSKRN